MKFEDLSSEQQAAANAHKGLNIVTAGAGTGKTTMLTFNIARLVESGVAPNNILALSFTRNAANEIAERASKLGNGGALVIAKTLHSLGLKVLRDNIEETGLEANFTLIDEDDAAKITKQHLKEWGEDIRTNGHPNSDVEQIAYAVSNEKDKKTAAETIKELDIQGAIEHWKENMIFPVDAIKKYENQGDTRLYIASIIYEKLQASLFDNNTIEISDIISMAARILMDNPEICEITSRRYHYVFVDEFQDVNFPQIQFLNCLASQYRNMVIVGDDDQSLYGFRSAIPDAMARAPKLLSRIASNGVHHYTLTQNRRSSDNVLTLANTLVEHNPRSGPKILTSGKTEGLVTSSAFLNDSIEGKEISNKIKVLLNNGVPPSEIAVLCRLSAPLTMLTKELLLKGIKYYMLSGTHFLDRKHIRDMLAWIKLAVNPYCTPSFERASGSPPRGLGPTAIQTIINMRRLKKISLIESLRLCVEDGVLKKSAHAGALAMADLLEELGVIGDDCQTSISKVIEKILEDTGYKDWLSESSKDSKELEKIFREIKLLSSLAEEMQAKHGSYTLVDFVDDLTLMESNRGEDKSDCICISTIHGSKGLEWQHVFVLGVEEGIMPLSKEEAGFAPDDHDPWDMETDSLEEERRLFHVALTRAKKNVYLTVAKKRFIGIGGRQSRFLSEMKSLPYEPKYRGPNGEAPKAVKPLPKRGLRL